ncbi:MAG: hypothetical protein N2484_05780 [Clostridia bacterium]|nr:hypothetical protein [Clostridia bacterium]
MKTAVWAFQGFVWTLINIGAIIGGYCIYKISGLGNQIIIQTVFALVLNILFLGIWNQLNRRYLKNFSLNLQDTKSIIAASSFGLLWSPFIFVSIHFITQGYLTSFGNILGIWLYQITVGILLLCGVSKLLTSGAVKLST